jgi:hypothetical protein
LALIRSRSFAWAQSQKNGTGNQSRAAGVPQGALQGDRSGRRILSLYQWKFGYSVLWQKRLVWCFMVQPMDVIGPWEVFTLLTAVLQSLTPFVHAQASSGRLLIAWQG